MATWIFVLVVFGFGLGLAIYVDRLKSRPDTLQRPRFGFGKGGLRDRMERFRWLNFWYMGRLPTKDELADEEDRIKKEEEGK